MSKNDISRSFDRSIFKFWGTSIVLSILVVLIYITTKKEKVFPFPHIFTNICCLCPQ
jgi:hypothetical protein